MTKNTGALLFEYHTPSLKPSTDFREEMLTASPIGGTRAMLASADACVTVGSCPTHPRGPVLLQRPSWGQKHLGRRSSCHLRSVETGCPTCFTECSTTLLDDGKVQMREYLPGFLNRDTGPLGILGRTHPTWPQGPSVSTARRTSWRGFWFCVACGMWTVARCLCPMPKET